MIFKAIFVVTCLAVVNGAVIDTSATSLPPLSISPFVPKTPAPIYEETDANQNGDKTKRTPLLNEKLTQIANNGAFLTQTYPAVFSSSLHAPVYYPSTYSVSPVLTNTVSAPVYTHGHGVPILTKTYSPVLSKAAEISTFSHAPIQNHATITYSDAPLVSHMTFNGLGTNYAW
ncbi:unnamed protein product [Leptosia nina]|uniref:Pupal cuticle protein C1B n=1 Tax=Leptosia nina TaxID=320188 RepID=A0AAV1K2M1_9NEOP